MSRKIAAALAALVDAANAIQPARQRHKTIANLMGLLERRAALPIVTPHGPLRILGHRSRHVATAANNFFSGEPEMLEWIDRMVQPGETLWDIGAAIGQFTLYAAQKGAKVVAFEPKAMSFGLLVEHVALNGLGGQVTALCLALSDKTGVTVLHLDDLEAGGTMNTLKGSVDQFGHTPQAFDQPVLSARMDDLVSAYGLAAPDHIKLDVDGVESWIIAGGPECLKGAKSVVIEVEGDNLKHVSTLLEPALHAAGLKEDVSFRPLGSARNRLYVRGDSLAWKTPAKAAS